MKFSQILQAIFLHENIRNVNISLLTTTAYSVIFDTYVICEIKLRKSAFCEI